MAEAAFDNQAAVAISQSLEHFISRRANCQLSGAGLPKFKHISTEITKSYAEIAGRCIVLQQCSASAVQGPKTKSGKARHNGR